jgi:hypothetical protein
MKKIVIFFLAAGLVAFSCKNNKEKFPGDSRNKKEKDNYLNGKEGDDENGSSSGNWSSADVQKFNRECKDELTGEELDENTAADVCECLLGKVQNKYANYEEMDNDDSNAGEKMVKDCVTKIAGNKGNISGDDDDYGSSQWTSKDISEYVDNCVSSAVENGMDRSNARIYCSCMQQKFENNYPNPGELIRMSENEIMRLSTKFAQQCLGNE